MRKSYGPGIRTLMMLYLRRTLVLHEFYPSFNSHDAVVALCITALQIFCLNLKDCSIFKIADLN